VSSHSVLQLRSLACLPAPEAKRSGVLVFFKGSLGRQDAVGGCRMINTRAGAGDGAGSKGVGARAGLPACTVVLTVHP